MARSRYTIVRVLGSIPRWLGRLEASRYVGMTKTHGQHVLEALAYKLIQPPGDHHPQGIAKTERRYPKGHLAPTKERNETTEYLKMTSNRFSSMGQPFTKKSRYTRRYTK
jgi:hypothetical protein